MKIANCKQQNKHEDDKIAAEIKPLTTQKYSTEKKNNTTSQ